MSTGGNTESFKLAFQEEAREILVELETALLELNENPSDQELVGRVFRALHTIKGSGSMFGFDELAAFTHNLETAFDAVRNGRIQVNSTLIDLTLSALDQIRAMVEEGAVTPVNPELCREILDKARELTGAPVSRSSSAASKASEFVPEVVSAPMLDWFIRFAPGPEFMRNGADPLVLLRELRQLGGLAVRSDRSQVPNLGDIVPERCYVSWELVLTTEAGLDAIRDVFVFVEDCCDLSIEAATNAGSAKKSSATQGVAGSSKCADEVARALEEQRAQTAGRRTYDKTETASSLRVPAAKLDQFVNLVGELVTVQARLSELAARTDDVEMVKVSEEIERLTSALRENSMTIRMIPIRGTFEKFRRLVHDLARDLGKDVDLSMEGADTELDKTVIDQLGDPLMHLIRNSMDHGIESPELRAERGKNPTATIHLSARHSGASVLIGVSDDGGGIDTEAVYERAIERGLAMAGASLTDQQVFQFIFQPGFSTAKKVTDVSGRGVGMDVVRQRVDSLRGTIDVASKAGLGASVTLRLPLTLAIIDGLLVRVGEASFVLPLANTLECIELTRKDIEDANGKQVANVRGELIPYISLRQHFDIQGERPEIEQIMVVETEDGRYGFVVDQVLGNCQTVIKNLGRVYRHVQVVSGATILGNGTVALILDPQRLAQDAVRGTTQQLSRGHLGSAKTRGRPKEKS